MGCGKLCGCGKLWVIGCGLWGVERCVEVKLQNKYFFRIIEYMKKVGSSFKNLSGLIVGGIILVLLCLFVQMFSREGFTSSACIEGGMCNTDNDTTCVHPLFADRSVCFTLNCITRPNRTGGKWVQQGKAFTC